MIFFFSQFCEKKISKFNDRIWKEFIIKCYYFFQTLDLILEKKSTFNFRISRVKKSISKFFLKILRKKEI